LMWIKPEYDYYDFGKINLKMPITAAGAIAGVAAGPVTFNLPISVNQQIHTVRVGANYQFNSPVVAKYCSNFLPPTN
jgi:opacity protein-like surface antigen